jgi:hypothetical protein
VFGQEGASTRFFMMLASLPLLSIPQGIGKVQPVHAHDVAEAALWLLESAPGVGLPSHRIIDLPGPRALDYGEWMDTYRRLMELPPAPHLPIPARVMAAAARIAGLSSRSLLCRDTWIMLAQGNCGNADGAAALLGHPLTDPAHFVPPDAARALRFDALAAWRRPLFIGALAAIWLFTALFSCGLFPFSFPVAQSLALLAPFGLTGTAAMAVLILAVALDFGMGILTLLRPCRRLWLFQLLLVAGYTALIAWRLPEFLIHPFGPALKNLAVAALLLSLHAEENAS